MIGKKRLFTRTIVGIMLLLVLTAISGLAAIPSVHASPSIVQQASSGSTGQSYQITLTGVTAGDLIVVSESEGFQYLCACASFPVAVTDSQGNSYAMIVQRTQSTVSDEPNMEASIWYTVASGGADTITVSLNGCTAAHSQTSFCGDEGAVAYELSGFTATGVVSSTGYSSSPSCCSTGSFTPSAGSFVVAAAGETGGIGGWSAGSNYTLSTNVSPFDQAQSEFALWTGGSTNAPLSSTGASQGWIEAAATFPAVPVTTSTVTTTSTLTSTQTSTSTVIATTTLIGTTTQDTTTTLTTGTCGTITTTTDGQGMVIKGFAADPTVTETTTATSTSTTVTTTTITETATTGVTSTNTVTETTCTTNTSTGPTTVPEFPLSALSAIVLVALLLPILLLMKRNGRFQRSTL